MKPKLVIAALCFALSATANASNIKANHATKEMPSEITTVEINEPIIKKPVLTMQNIDNSEIRINLINAFTSGIKSLCGDYFKSKFTCMINRDEPKHTNTALLAPN